jgi:hypothetical protein
MIGHLKGVRKIEVDGFVDGEWKTEIPMVELTVYSESLDLDNQPTFSMDKHNIEDKYFNKYKSLVNEVIAVPYLLEVTSKKQKWEFDKTMPILVLKDTLVSMVKTDKK